MKISPIALGNSISELKSYFQKLNEIQNIKKRNLENNEDEG